MAVKKPTAFRIRPELLAELDRDAFRRGFSRNQLVDLLLEQYLSKSFDQRNPGLPRPVRGRTIKSSLPDIMA